MRLKRGFSLLLSGILLPVLGVVIYLLQGEISAHHGSPWASYWMGTASQLLLLLPFIWYPYWIGHRSGRHGDGPGCQAMFFLFPVLGVLLMHTVFRHFVDDGPYPAAFLLSGVDLPFFFLPQLRYAMPGPLRTAVEFLPILICVGMFCFGVWAGRRMAAGRPAAWTQYLWKVVVIAVVLLRLAAGLIPDVDVSLEDAPRYSAYEIRAGLVPDADPDSVPEGDGSVVCVMRLYADAESHVITANGLHYGHAFLTFLNVTDAPITVGQASVEPGTMISVGKFGNVPVPYDGLYYNVELQRKQSFGWYTGSVSVFKELTAEQLETVSQVLIDHQDGYSIYLDNCSILAGAAWNSVTETGSGDHIVSCRTPTLLSRQLRTMDACVFSNWLIAPDYDSWYYDGTGVQVPCGGPLA